MRGGGQKGYNGHEEVIGVKPPKEVLFASEERKSLSEIAAFLRAAADGLERGVLILAQDERRVEVRPQGSIVLEVEYEVQGEKEKLEIEVEWMSGIEPLSIP